MNDSHLFFSGGVLGEVLAIVGVEDGPTWVTDGQAAGVTVTVNVVVGATVGGELGRLVNQRSGPGIGTNVVSLPEGAAEIDNSEFSGI